MSDERTQEFFRQAKSCVNASASFVFGTLRALVTDHRSSGQIPPPFCVRTERLRDISAIEFRANGKNLHCFLSPLVLHTVRPHHSIAAARKQVPVLSEDNARGPPE